jgi:hypothetical protein
MTQRRPKQTRVDVFGAVTQVGLTLPGVEVATRYDGSPVLKLHGCFMAGLATHRSAEPETLVIRAGVEERAWLLEDAPETYYVTDYYRRYPLVLVRLSRIDRGSLRDLLSISWRLTAAKATRARPQARGRSAVHRRTPRAIDPTCPSEPPADQPLRKQGRARTRHASRLQGLDR